MSEPVFAAQQTPSDQVSVKAPLLNIDGARTRNCTLRQAESLQGT